MSTGVNCEQALRRVHGDESKVESSYSMNINGIQLLSEQLAAVCFACKIIGSLHSSLNLLADIAKLVLVLDTPATNY